MAFWKKLLSKNSKYRKKRRSRAEIWAFKVADLIFPKDSESFVRSQKFLLELELQTFSRFRPFTIVYQLQQRKFCLFRARTQTCYIPLERAWVLVSNELSTSLFGPGLVTWPPVFHKKKIFCTRKKKKFFWSEKKNFFEKFFLQFSTFETTLIPKIAFLRWRKFFFASYELLDTLIRRGIFHRT